MVDIAHDRLPARLDSDMLHPDGLLTLAAHPRQSFDLGSEGALKLDRHVPIQL
ncbi:hypothetical protein [Sphingobium yanoikuyae]|uniref:hypothetical protein n=1 Tax=Sphingobium yanoikuyae TaxID=13690 RepID=UPI0035E404A2